jgi:hypothetical protein
MTTPKAKVAIARKALKKAASKKKVKKVPVSLDLHETASKEAPALEVVIHDPTLFEQFLAWLKSL